MTLKPIHLLHYILALVLSRNADTVQVLGKHKFVDFLRWRMIEASMKRTMNTLLFGVLHASGDNFHPNTLVEPNFTPSHLLVHRRFV